jgi:hypothetical protein
MVELIVLNSNLTIIITLQNWPVDTLSPFADSLIKKGFTVNRPTAIQQMQVQAGPFAAKGTITALGIEYATRRILMQITNNITSPNENLEEVLSALTTIGYPPQESIERIDIQGTITIKTQGVNASTFVPNIIKEDFTKYVQNVFEREVNTVGIRLATKESFTSGLNSSPFIILLEPLFNDPTDTKLLVQLSYVSYSHDNSIQFLEDLYDRLKNVILGFKGKDNVNRAEAQ